MKLESCMRVLSEIVRCALIGEKPNVECNENDWYAVYDLAEFHNVSNLLAKPLSSVTLPEDLRSKLEKAKNRAMFSYLNQQAAYESIISELEKRNIRYMPMKGSVLRKIYPSPDMRTAADLDIYFDKSKKVEIKSIMESLGFLCSEKTDYHDTYTLNAAVSVEMHYELVRSDLKWYNSIMPIKDRLVRTSENRLDMTCEDFYLFMLSHFAKHISHGGSGIRAVADIWLYLKKYESVLNKELLDERLKEAELSVFNSNVKELVGYLFENKEGSSVTKQLALFIANSGWNGTETHKKALMSESYAEKGKLTYVFRYTFKSRKELMRHFPVLEKWPVLLPFIWIYRIINAVFIRRGAAKEAARKFDDFEKDAVKKTRDFIKTIGI